MDGHEDDLRPRAGRFKKSGGLDAVQYRHGDVKDQDIKAEPGSLFEDRPSISRGRDDLELRLEESSFDREELLVVVGQEYTAPAQGFLPVGSGSRNGTQPPPGCPHPRSASLRIQSHHES